MNRRMQIMVGAVALVLGSVAVVGVHVITAAPTRSAQAAKSTYVLNDSHVHLTNYIQEGVDIHTFLRVMGDRVGRATLFGIPLQQTWSYRVDQGDAPQYYLDSDAELYYYSFTDAAIAMAYRSLTTAEQKRFDPMITGFNPADMYAADHVRRVLDTYPGVFEGIGEFSLHKEFVTSKLAGGPPSLDDPAIDRLLSFAEEVGLVVLIHCDLDTPFPKPGADPAYMAELGALVRRHPKTTIIWAHVGVGRVVRPIKGQLQIMDRVLDDPTLAHVMFDLSWNETAKYIVATPETTKAVAAQIEKHPDRFIFGTDEVAPKNQHDYLRVYDQYAPLWKLLTPATVQLVLQGNYVRIFDAARARVRAWEATSKARRETAGASP